MSNCVNARRSPYMEWAKTGSAAQFNLATSGIMNVPMSEFPLRLEDLELTTTTAYAYEHPGITARIAQKYSRRMDLIVPMLWRLGFAAEKPRGSFFLYVPAPVAATPSGGGARTEFASAEAVAQWLITEHLISTVPWDDAGAYLRFSVTFAAGDEADEQRVVAEMERRLARYQYEF